MQRAVLAGPCYDANVFEMMHCATNIYHACAAVVLSSCCYRYPLQGYAMKSGPACSRIVQHLNVSADVNCHPAAILVLFRAMQ
jgi:hypothetical protein